jgi:hypothetical protein
MPRSWSLAWGLSLFGLGCLSGALGVEAYSTARAQAPAPIVVELSISEGAAAKVREATLALRDALQALQAEGQYESITDGTNSFLVFSGGGNAREDLESGQGVDPETFAALYAGLAIPEIADHLGRDPDGRLTYQNKVVRMYSASRLQQSFARQMQLADVGL